MSTIPTPREAKAWAGDGCESYRDFRRVLDRKDVDAVLVATPDHWHAIPTVLACQAGKDVYVEKPLAHNIREGRAMVEAARASTTASCRPARSTAPAAHYREAARIVQSGELGPVHFVRIWNYTNLYPGGIGAKPDSQPPDGLDWDFYLGPAPGGAVQPQPLPGHVPLVLGLRRRVDHRLRHAPLRQRAPGDGRRCPATRHRDRQPLRAGRRRRDAGRLAGDLRVSVVHPELRVLQAQRARRRRPHAGQALLPRSRQGRPAARRGVLRHQRDAVLRPDRLRDLSRDGAGTAPIDAAAEFRMERKEAAGEDATAEHARELHRVRPLAGKPAADVEIGHRSTIVPHLGNIAYRTGRKIRWDAEKERIVDDPDAAKLLGARRVNHGTCYDTNDATALNKSLLPRITPISRMQEDHN